MARLSALVLALALAVGSLVAQPAAAEEQELPLDDACAAGEAGSEACELSLRQLRATQSSAPAAKHDHQAEVARANATAASCTAEDAAEMKKLGSGNGDGSFPKITAQCGRSAYKWFRFHSDDMSSCLQRRTSISETCAACFVAAGRYGVDHCKLQCLFGSWCSEACLGCSSKASMAAQVCAGVAVPEAEYC